ncbi:MAG: NAD(+) synthase, partial [Anaerolineales bacterium]|nr:NAD(+) synthase [Anaerolineales bacterium]
MEWIDERLRINPDLAQTILTDFIRQELGRHGFEKAIVGVSGGVDSSLACYLSAAALGPENVLAVRMPYKSSSDESMEHAGLIIDDLGVQQLDVEITDMVEPLFARFDEMDRVRRGNVMARARM